MRVISFSGNASVGKTTCLTRAISHLKERKVRVGYVFDVVRGTLMDMSKLDCPHGRRLILYRHLAEETAHLLREDIDVLLLDRGALDWYAYLAMEDAKVNPAPYTITGMAEWGAVYHHALNYLAVLHFETAGFAYVKDGFRPPDDSLRDRVESYYKALLDTHVAEGNLVVPIGGSTIGERWAATEDALEGLVGDLYG